MHLSNGFDTDNAGFIKARCTCGWQDGWVPDEETAIDSLMEHVAVETIRPVVVVLQEFVPDFDARRFVGEDFPPQRFIDSLREAVLS